MLPFVHSLNKRSPSSFYVPASVLRLEVLQRTQAPAPDRSRWDASSVLVPLWPWACSSPEPPFSQLQNIHLRRILKSIDVDMCTVVGPRAGPQSVWALLPYEPAELLGQGTSSFRDVQFGLHWEDSVLAPWCVLLSRTSPYSLEGIETTHEKLMSAVRQVSHGHGIRYKIRSATTTQHIWSHDLEVPPFKVRGFSGKRMGLKCSQLRLHKQLLHSVLF